MSRQWIDLNDGSALSPERVKSVTVLAPMLPHTFEGYYRVYLEQETWRVIIADERSNIHHGVFMSWDEGAARRRASQIVHQMVEHAEALS